MATLLTVQGRMRHLESIRVEVSCFEYEIHTAEMRRVIGMLVMLALSMAPLPWVQWPLYCILWSGEQIGIGFLSGSKRG